MSQQCCAVSLGVMLGVSLLQLVPNKWRIPSCGEMLRQVEMISTCRNVMRQFATWKCVARQVARAGTVVIRATLCSTCNTTLTSSVATQLETIYCSYYFTFTLFIHKTLSIPRYLFSPSPRVTTSSPSSSCVSSRDVSSSPSF